MEAKLVMQSKLGAFTGVQWVSLMADCIPTSWRDDVNSAWQLLGVPQLSIDDQPAKPIAYDNTSSFIVVRKGYEHPEAAVKILNMLHKIGAGMTLCIGHLTHAIMNEMITIRKELTTHEDPHHYCLVRTP